MKVYVSEMPKSCKDCFFCEHIEENVDGKGRDEVACYFEGFLNNVLLGETFNAKNCKHLQSLTDHDKQLTEQICDQIREKLNKVERPKNYPELDCEYGFDTCIYAIEDILNEIEQGERNDR